MAHIIVTGATGLAGSAILAECLASPSVAKVTVLSRRPVKLADNNPKAQLVIWSDYASYPTSVLDQLRGASGCIWAQGKSSVGMNEDEYTTLTHGWPIAAAQAFSELPSNAEKMKFVYISGEGADPTEKSRQMFGRVKGRAEKDLIALATNSPSLVVYNLRPGMIDPMGRRSADHPSSLVRDLSLMLLGPVLRVAYPSAHTPAHKLAKVSVRLATGDNAPVPTGQGIESDGWTLRNTAIRRLSGL